MRKKKKRKKNRKIFEWFSKCQCQMWFSMFAVTTSSEKKKKKIKNNKKVTQSIKHSIFIHSNTKTTHFKQ